MNVKQATMQALASQAPAVRAQVAVLIAAIASIEIPRGEWHELITTLCQNAENQEQWVKKASLQTLGYVCEELNPSDLSQELKN